MNNFHYPKKYLQDFLTLLISLIITAPGLLILKTNSGGKGVMPPEFIDISSVIDIVYHLAITILRIYRIDTLWSCSSRLLICSIVFYNCTFINKKASYRL